MTQEHQPRHRDSGEPLHPTPLPEELAEFLREQGPYACVTQATDQGVAFVLKAPAKDIQSVRGTVPVQVWCSLFDHPEAPVIRTVIKIYDQPLFPLAFETFCNVDDPQQRDDFAALAEQEHLILLFYDEELRHRLNKLVPNPRDEALPRILAQAQELRAAIPDDRFNFDAAKARVMEETRL